MIGTLGRGDTTLIKPTGSGHLIKDLQSGRVKSLDLVSYLPSAQYPPCNKGKGKVVPYSIRALGPELIPVSRQSARR